MIREIFRQLRLFRNGIRQSLLPPVGPTLSSREGVAPSPGSVNDGGSAVVEQTRWDEEHALTKHAFMLDVDPLDTGDAELA